MISSIGGGRRRGRGSAYARQGTGEGLREPFANPFATSSSNANPPKLSDLVEMDVIDRQTGAASL